MDIKANLRRAWHMVWQYRVLWILGMVLALTAGNTIYLGPWQDEQDIPRNNRIKISEYSTIILPGDGLTIDLTAPEGHRVIFADGTTLYDFRSSDLNVIATVILVLVTLMVLITTISRYVAETAMIRMVNDTEESGKQLTLRQGVRLGWSVRAVRLFLIDLLFGLAGVGFVALMLSLIIGPTFLIEPLGIFAVLLIAFGAFGLLILTFYLLVAWGILVSLIMQTVRRACVIDGRGVFASIGTGFTLLKHNFKEVGITWFIWIAIRILWAPASLLVILILSPILFLFMLAGILTGIVPGALATGIASLFMTGATPWIIGGITGLPIFILVTITPLLIVNGLVEIYKSCIWTLAYRDLKAMKVPDHESTIQAKMTLARGVAD